MKKIEEESTMYSRQFELRELEKDDCDESKFQDLLNYCVSQKILKRKQLFDVYPEKEQQVIKNDYEEEISQVKQYSEQMINYQQNLEKRHDQIIGAKLLLEKKCNQLKEVIKNIKMVELQEVQKNNEEIIRQLQFTHSQINQFEQVTEKYKTQEMKKQAIRKKDIEKLQDQLRLQEQQKALLTKQLQEQKQILQQLKEEEEQKKKRNHESFKIQEYIEFFMEIKYQFIEQADDSESTNSIVCKLNNSIRQRQSTRNEIVNMLDEFYNNENLNQVVSQTIQLYRDMQQQKDILINKYDDKLVEKQIKEKQIKKLNIILTELAPSQNIQYIGMIPQSNQEITLNQAKIEGPAVVHENYQIKYHIKVNQSCLITIYMKVIDLLQRMCIGLIWLQEASKLLPKNLDNLCYKFLKAYSNLKMQLFIPKPQKPNIKPQRQGSFVSLNKRSSSPKSSTNSPISEQHSNDPVEWQDELKTFQQHIDFQIIKQAWTKLIKGDQLFFMFPKRISFDSIDNRQSAQNIVCDIYTIYGQIIQKIKFIQPYQTLFQYYRDLMKLITKRKQEKAIIKIKQPLSDSYEMKNFQFLNLTKQNQLQRLLVAKNPISEDEQKSSLLQSNRTADETKYHNYLVLQSNKIQKQKPLLHEKLLEKTMEDIERMKQKEMLENFQTSDQTASDVEYLNSERRNIKGIVNKKFSTSVSNKQTKSEDDSFSSIQSKMIKNTSLLQKISKLNSLNRTQNYDNLNRSLKQLNQQIKRKISDYFTNDIPQNPILQQTESQTQLRSSTIRKMTTKYPLQFPPTEKQISKSQELTEKRKGTNCFSDRNININIKSFHRDQSFYFNYSKKEKSITQKVL